MANPCALFSPSNTSKEFTSTYIVEELWPEILKRITDVKSLCRFRCVCKSWNSLLSSHRFMTDQYLMTSTAAAANKSYLLSYIWNGSFELNAIYHPQATPCQRITYLDFPFRSRRGVFNVVDAINGIICMSYYVDAAAVFGDFPFLWMPTVQKYVDIPMSPFHGRSDGQRAMGFGYHSSENDFKVLRIFSYCHNYYCFEKGLHDVCRKMPPTCEVFSVKNWLWRKVHIPALCINFLQCTSSFTNGNIHWLTEIGTVECKRSCLLLFDCERGEFRTLELPESTHVETKVFRYHGMLSLLEFNARDGYCDLWVMEEYGVASTWKKLFRVDPIDPPNGRLFIFREDAVAKLAFIGPNHDRMYFYFEALRGLALEESMFLTDSKSRALSYMKQEKDGKVFYVKDDRTECDYIKLG